MHLPPGAGALLRPPPPSPLLPLPMSYCTPPTTYDSFDPLPPSVAPTPSPYCTPSRGAPPRCGVRVFVRCAWATVGGTVGGTEGRGARFAGEAAHTNSAETQRFAACRTLKARKRNALLRAADPCSALSPPSPPLVLSGHAASLTPY